MITEPLGNFNDIKSIGFELYKFNTKPSLPYVKVKRAQNIPQVYYDENSITEKVVDQLATENYSNQIKESFENIGYTPKTRNANGNIHFTSSHINEVKKNSFEKLSPLLISAKQMKRDYLNSLDTKQVKSEFNTPKDMNLTPKNKSNFTIIATTKVKKEIPSNDFTKTFGKYKKQEMTSEINKQLEKITEEEEPVVMERTSSFLETPTPRRSTRLANKKKK